MPPSRLWTVERTMNLPPVAGAAPARFSDADQARMAAREFDLRRLPAGLLCQPLSRLPRTARAWPVHRMPDGCYFLTRYDDLRGRLQEHAGLLLRQEEASSGRNTATRLLYEHHTTSLVFNDPPLHTRVRRADHGRAVAARDRRHGARLVRLVDRPARCHGRRRRQVDLIDDFAAAIPIEVIGNLLDVPRDERGPLRDWSLAILGALEPVLTPDSLRARQRRR